MCIRDSFENAFCLSADVTAAYDPNFADVYEKKNAAFVNYGVGIPPDPVCQREYRPFPTHADSPRPYDRICA